jgi:hypothetical protein
MASFYSGGASSLAGLQLVPLNRNPAARRSHAWLVRESRAAWHSAQAGLQGGDVLVSADSVDLRSIGMLQRVINE